MNEDFGDRSGAALVTGGSGGMGAAVCTALAARGSDIGLTYHRNRERADEVVAAIVEAGRRARAWPSALDDADAVAGVVDEVASDFGGIHTLVYASGPHVPMIHVSRITPDAYRRQLEVDAMAFFNVAHAALPHLRETRGAIVALTTVATRRFPPRDVMSSSPKGAVEAVVRAIAYEEGRFGVRANCVGPGIMGEGMTARLLETGELEDEHLESTRRAIPLRKLGTASDVAEAVSFLASDRAAYITGQYIDVDGGYSI